MSKVAVITGAGAGVGRATVEEFARQGYDVALLSRDPDRLTRAVANLAHYGVRTLGGTNLRARGAGARDLFRRDP